jgi:hypothetical protein
MKLAIMQPYLFPYIGYFQLINAVDKFITYDDVNFIKQGWINRNRILISGSVNYITVPLSNASSFLPINQVGIQPPAQSNWRSKWLKTLQQSYGKASNFNEAFPLIESIITHEYTLISDLASKSISTICQYLDIQTPIHTSSIDHRDSQHLHAAQRVIEICRQEDCKQYINPIGGIDLYSREAFLEENIVLSFIQPNAIHYQQSKKEFQPWLSIIDVLMHNSKPQTQQFLSEYRIL